MPLKILKCFSGFFLFVWLSFFSSLALADRVSLFSQWQRVIQKTAQSNDISSELSISDVATNFTTDLAALNEVLLADKSDVVISLPLPDGTLIDVKLSPSTVMATELAQNYPMIKTFIGVITTSSNIFDEPSSNNTGRFDITPNGFHGMFNYYGEEVFIEPLAHGDKNQYISYFRSNIKHLEQPQQPKKLPPIMLADSVQQSVILPVQAKINSIAQSRMRTYRLAVSAAAEYTLYHGGSKTTALAEIVTMVNRLNQVFNRDLGIHLQLVANNDELIFTNKNTDPFSNTDSDESVNTGVINDRIGEESYDIGHVVGTGGGGLAVLGAACTVNKGNGVTGASNPVNDAFYIDYVAHELGHQFNADHSFNGTTSACSDNRIFSAAYEPGSGSTIMSYVGICGSENLQTHSDAYFHSSSISTIKAFINNINLGGSCGSYSGNINNDPEVNAGQNYTIPANSPFILTGSATDLDNDTLTYSWQQYDLGTASSSASSMVDDGSRPIFRSFNPVSDPVRILPKMSDVLSGSLTKGEAYPTTNRDVNFRLLVRDNKGATSFDSTKITVVDTGEVFAVSSPIEHDLWQNNNQEVRWNVADSHLFPISCLAVDISLSQDNGATFSQTLAQQVSNNGSALLTLSGINTSQARLKIQCSDNIFFALNDGVFNIAIDDLLKITDQQLLSFTEGDSLTLTPSMFSYFAISANNLLVADGDNYSVSGTTITASDNFSGGLTVAVTAVNGNKQSETFIAEITVNEAPEPEPEPAPEVSSSSSSGASLWLFVLILLAAVVRIKMQYQNINKPILTNNN